MNPIIKNVGAVVLGVIVGGFVNMSIIMLSGSIIPLPEGLDQTDMDSYNASIHLLSTKHYIMPFLAHAVGTLVGALLAAKIAATNKMLFAIVIGVFFLAGGIMASYMLSNSPNWFKAFDIILAYIPMAWIGGKLGMK
jgi:hypothetical protein